MVDYSIRIKEATCFEDLKEAYKKAMSTDQDYVFIWENNGPSDALQLEIQDNAIQIHFNDPLTNSWIWIPITEFTEEMVIAMIEDKPELVTEKLFKTVVGTFEKKKSE